jgi:hypothetical protein
MVSRLHFRGCEETMTGILPGAIRDLIYSSRNYWPDDSYFHRRNRWKLENAWSKLAQLHDLDSTEVVCRYTEILEHRRERKVPTLYAMSNGGSGCHFLGQLLDGLDGIALTDEVYFPPRLLKEIETSYVGSDALAVDFINFFHAGVVERESHDLRVVNIGHLRRDTSPARLARMDVSGCFILLLRNPYEVAVSRAFRKPEYRAQVAPGVPDDEYLQRQVDGTKSFLTQCRAVNWHQVVRYEDLKTNPVTVIDSLVRRLGMTFDEERFELVRHSHDASNLSVGALLPEAINLNTKVQEALTQWQLEVLEEGLADLASEFGYSESELMVRSREGHARKSSGSKAGPAMEQSSTPDVSGR